jgi:hypothetical protein
MISRRSARRAATLSLAVGSVAAASAHAHAPTTAPHHSTPTTPRAALPAAPFDITKATVLVRGNTARFRMQLRSEPGRTVPQSTGTLAGSSVESYVWPTSLDPSTVGFPARSGTLALAVTSHPDFDDTPLFDENANGRRDDDGVRWHSHWVVLAPAATCNGGLHVVDIKEGDAPSLPVTWPGLPLLIDSPGWQPIFGARRVEVVVPFRDPAVLRGAHFDAVTAALRVDADLHTPLLCVNGAHDVWSGDLSLPGVVHEQ